jgi:two-component system response regulator ResD
MHRLEELSATSQVLIVDDDPSIREVLKMLLEAQGYEVEAAENGPQALRMFSEHEWSAVITDRMMPGMSGEELAASIRNIDAKIPIVLVSGQLFDREGGFEFNAVVQKPFNSRTLGAALETAMSPN